jgi:hypothetical protein
MSPEVLAITIHPANSLCITNLAEIDLSGFQILVPQNNFRNDFQGDTVSAGICGRICEES